jgi:hypothetical protein
VIERVGNNRCHSALGETKAGLTIPGNFHSRTSVRNYTRYGV